MSFAVAGLSGYELIQLEGIFYFILLGISILTVAILQERSPRSLSSRNRAKLARWTGIIRAKLNKQTGKQYLEICESYEGLFF